MKAKKILPKTLFARFLLIITLPTIIIQAVSIYIFYQRHWDVVSKRLSQNLVNDIYLSNQTFDKEIASGRNYNRALNKIQKDFNLDVIFIEGAEIKQEHLLYEKYNPPFIFDSKRQFENELITNIKEKMYFAEFDDRNFVLKIQKDEGVLNFTISKKRIITITTKIFILWTIGIAFIMLLIAILFLKNQIKPIKRLTKFVKRINLNKNINFRPSGAKEIREVGIAFLKMRKRIEKFVNQRTVMLAAISHDLRTPLTRMKLQLEMMDNKNVKYIKSDIEEMENMINEYLSFAKGEHGEEYKKIKLKSYIRSIVKDYKRLNYHIELNYEVDGDKLINIKPFSFKRALNNIIGNGLKYGDKVLVSVMTENRKVVFIIEDDGEGVSDEELTRISEPFYKTDISRNMEKGGVGLGLAIAKDIINAHNGSISFARSEKLGGLKVVVKIGFSR